MRMQPTPIYSDSITGFQGFQSRTEPCIIIINNDLQESVAIPVNVPTHIS